MNPNPRRANTLQLILGTVHAAIASAVLFVINGLLVLYVFNFDRKIKQR